MKIFSATIFLSVVLLFLSIFIFLSHQVFAQTSSPSTPPVKYPNLNYWNLQGYVFDDTNQNQKFDKDQGEQGHPGVTITFTQTSSVNPTLVDTPSTGVSENDGAYRTHAACGSSVAITPCPAGASFTQTVIITPPPGYKATGPTSYTTTLSAAHPTDRYDFGIIKDDSSPTPSASPNPSPGVKPLCRNRSDIPQDTSVRLDDKNRDKVIAPTMHNDRQIADALTKKLLPQEINDQFSKEKEPEVKVGIEPGFPNLLCNLGDKVPLAKGFLEKLGLLCPRPVDFDQLTQHFTEKAHIVALSERPKELNPSPMPHDCFLEDYQDGNKSSIGNKDIDTINTSLGVNVGVYSIDLPDFKKKASDTEAAKTGILDLNKNNISLNKEVFNGDYRAPNVNKECQYFNKAAFPTGIGPCQ